MEEYSLVYPHVPSNGKSPNVEFKNDYLIRTKSRSDYTQLGHKHAESFGMIKFTKELGIRDYNVEIDFSLIDGENGGKDAGFGFWIDREPENGPSFCGKSSKIGGMGVFIDSSNQPSIKYVDSLGTRRSLSNISKTSYNIALLIEKRKSNISIKVTHQGKSNILYEGVCKISAESFLYITSFSGKSDSTLNINRILFNRVFQIDNRVYVKGKRKSNTFVIIIGLFSIAGLIYYLLIKREKEFHLKS